MRITFRLKDERDDDLINWFNIIGAGERSFFIRQALRRSLCSEEQAIRLPALSEMGTPSKPVLEEPVTTEEAENRLSNMINKL